MNDWDCVFETLDSNGLPSQSAHTWYQMADSTSDNSIDRTRASLLIRVRDIADEDAWRHFHNLYSPLMYDYARSRGLNHEDAEDVRSECYASLVRQMQGFEYDRSKGSFKSWLRTMVSRRVIDRLRKRREHSAESHAFRQIPDDTLTDDEVWEAEWRRQHLRYCVELAQPLVSQQVWDAFRMLAEEGAAVPAVCKALNLTANQVYKAKSRMLGIVREQMQFLETAE